MNNKLSPVGWCDLQNKLSEHFPETGVTQWFDGTTVPSHDGWYDRQFSDGVLRQWWDRGVWRSTADGQPHWHQVGAYPSWRGRTTRYIADPIFVGWSNKGETCTVMYNGNYYHYELIEIQSESGACDEYRWEP